MAIGKSVKPKTKVHSGKSFGSCKICGNQFLLKRKTKHRAAKLLAGVTCPICGTPKKPEAQQP
jgi:transcription elongation factor Elf1